MRTKIKSLFRLAFPYIAIILLSVLTVLILCAYIFNSAAEKTVADQSAALSIATDRVDRKFDAVEEMSFLIGESDNMHRYIVNAMAGADNDLFECRELKNLISGISKNDSIAEIYFYDCYTGRIISSSTILSEPTQYFRYIYRIDDLTPEDAVAQLKAEEMGYLYAPARGVHIKNRAVDAIEYRLSMLPGQYGKPLSQLTLVLDASRIFQDFTDVLAGGAEFYVYNGETLMYSSGTEYAALAGTKLTNELQAMNTEKGKIYAAERTCAQNMWRIQFFYPDLSHRNDSSQIMAMLLIATLLPLILSICMCVYFTHKNHKEIVEMLALLRGEQADPEQLLDYSLVRQYAGEMAKENSAYRMRFSEIQQSRRQSTLSRLLRGAYRDSSQMEKELSAVDLQVTGACAAMCVQYDRAFIDSFTINNMTLPDLIAQTLETYAGVPMEIQEQLPTEVVCIFPTEGVPDTTADNLVSLLNVHIRYQYGIDLRIGIGGSVPTVRAINRSYEQANEVIRYAESTGKSIYHYEQTDRLDEVFFYPINTDDKISNYIIAGRGDDANEVIAGIYRENFLNESKAPSMAAIDLLKYRTANAVTSVAEKQDINVSFDMKKLLAEKNVKKYFQSLTELVTMITDEIMAKKNNDQNALSAQVRSYVLENFTNPGLSVKEIAKHFHFHENYISNQFKEEYKETLSGAIERVRIEKACQLLRTTDSRISEIAVSVGYSSDSSFRRAFKKVTGISPADYRESH